MKVIHYTIAVIVSTVLMLASLAVGYGLVMNDMAAAMAGTCTIMMLMVMLLVGVDRWER